MAEPEATRGGRVRRRGGPLLGLACALGCGGTPPAPPPYALEPALVAPERIVDAGFPADGIAALSDPRVVSGAAVAQLNEAQRGKYLVSGDLVVGVELDGEARAYPVRVLVWHEVVNDTLGGRPIAVTHSPLSDSTVVWERHLDGAPREFGVSGRLLDSTTLLYDRGPGQGSLWSQLTGRAVAGPAAGRELTALPSSVVAWSSWLERHPSTTVLAPPDPSRRRFYARNPYGPYRTTGTLRFPVGHLPAGDDPGWFTPVVALGGDGDVPPLVLVADRLPPGVFEVPGFAGVTLEGVPAGERTGVLVEAGPGIGVRHAAWFAWYAHHPETVLTDLRARQQQR